MKKSKNPPDVCFGCGRSRAEAATYVYRSNADRYVFHRCDCGAEWTEHREGIDPTVPVNGDEVIQVHVTLERFGGSFKDLLNATA